MGAVRGESAREFVKAFNAVCNWNNGWDRWNDMVNLFAIELINPVDWNYREERNQTYTRIAAKYKPEELHRFGELFGILVENLEKHPYQDFLGDMYMQLEMGSKSHGQCFTPFGVCQMMAETIIREDEVKANLAEHGWIRINDCACGAGATLIAAAERLRKIGINYQEKVLFVAQDLDTTVAMMCYIQLSLLGCAGRIRIGDTLTNPETGPILTGNGGPNTWYLPMFYTRIWAGRVYAWHVDQILNGFNKAYLKDRGIKARFESQTIAKKSEAEKEGKQDAGNGGIQISFFD